MNEKQAKRIRAQARNMGIDWRETVYVDKHPIHFNPIRLGGKALTYGAWWTGQAKLDPNCGRAVYHRVKANRQSQLRGKV